MLATTLLLASLSALALAVPTPGGRRDGDDIRFKQVKKINDDKFKKTNFNVHDAAVHDKNFNNVEVKDKDVLKKIDFRKNNDDDFFGIYKRQVDIGSDFDVDVDDPLDDDSLDVGNGIDFAFDLDTSIDTQFDDADIIDIGDFDDFDGTSDFVKRDGKRHGRGGDDIRFKDVKKINDDRFKKTNFNVHDKQVHDKNFNQVEAKDRDVLKVIDFRKDDDDDDFRHRRFGKHDRDFDGKHDYDY